MNAFRHVLTFVAAAAILGCAKDDPDQKVAFAIVDGHPITAAHVRDTVLTKAKLAEIAGRPIPKERFPVWANRTAMRIIPNQISVYLLDREIVREGVAPTADDRAKMLRAYNKIARTNLTELAQFKPLFGDLFGHFERQCERECRFAAYSRKHFTFDVSDADVDAYYRAKTNELRRAAKINRSAKSKADDAWKKLNAGGDWIAVAESCSEDSLLDEDNKDFHKEWGSFRPADVAADALGDVLPTLKKAGQYSPPFETSEGMVIVRANEIEGGLYTCSRILFRMARDVEVLAPDEVRPHLAKQKARDAQLATLENLRDKAKIEYPLGKKFTYKIWKEPERARKGPLPQKGIPPKLEMPKK